MTEDEAKKIEQNTRAQSECAEWFKERRQRITATMCKYIVCRRKTDVAPLVERKLKGTFYGNVATRYGLQHEAKAMEEYVASQQQSHLGCTVNKSGLVISMESPYLACSTELFVEWIERDNDLLLAARQKLETFYHEHFLPALFTSAASVAKATPTLREVEHQGVRCSFLPSQYSQSTIDGRNGSSACTVISAHVVLQVLSGTVPTVANFITSMRRGNEIYEGANLGGELLAVYDAVNLLHARFIVAPRGDIGCRHSNDLAAELLVISKRTASRNETAAGILVQCPFSMSVVFTPVREVSFLTVIAMDQMVRSWHMLYAKNMTMLVKS